MFRKMFASLGIGGARVETYLTTPTVVPGSYVQGHTEVRGGDVEQTIESLEIVLNTSYVREGDDQSWTEQWVLYRQAITRGMLIQPGAQQTIPFQIPVPFETPLTIGHQPVTVYTDLNIAGGMDSTDHDALQVMPHPTMQRTFDAIQALGFSIYSTKCKHHPHHGRPVPFMQEFEFRPHGSQAWRIEEIEVVFGLTPTDLEIILEVDRRGRGLGGWFESMTETNERVMRLRIPHGIDQQSLFGTLQSAIQRAAH